jgi:hypothetical protein
MVRVGKNLKSLVASLLTVDAVKRLGTHGASEVMQHPCLKDIDWNRMLLRQYLVCSSSHTPTVPDSFFLFEFRSSLQAPYIPPTPHPCASWQNHSLPEQSKIPGLKIVDPPLHLVHDNRFPLLTVWEVWG